MSRIRDFEDLIKAFKDYVRDNINTYIESINSEKGDSLLDSVNPIDKYFLLDASLVDVPNYPFFTFYTPENIQEKNNYNNMMSVIKINVDYAFATKGKETDVYKSYRMVRVLKETIINFESSAQEVGDLLIEESYPILKITNTLNFLISGVGVSISIS